MEEFEENEIGEEEQEAFMDWWNANFPKEFVTILNTREYLTALKAIKKILDSLSISCDPDEMPKLKIAFDKAFGTSMALDVTVPEYGITIMGKTIRETVSLLPDNCNLLIMPKTDGTTLAQFTFSQVKHLVGSEDSDDPV